MKNLPILIVAIYLIFSFNQAFSFNSKDTMLVAFWNLENLFDTIDDPKKQDEEFLPDSKKQWDEDKLKKKMKNLSETINSMNYGKGPDLLGVCEIENEFVLKELVNKYLDKKYFIVHKESPDNRGIDVGLLLRKDKFKVIQSVGIEIELPDKYPTRLILYTQLLYSTKDTLHLFVNHWPSRRGGEEKSEKNRNASAYTLKNFTDEILSKNRNAKIICVGDFNDEPNNMSILEVLNAKPFYCSKKISKNDELLNLAYEKFENGEGSYKYRDDWNLIDQIIVSENLINGSIKYICNSYEIYKPYFLQTHSGKYEGAPFPTYGGDRYLGGYSDHYPVIAKFLIDKK